jgi:hypothetical protein
MRAISTSIVIAMLRNKYFKNKNKKKKSILKKYNIKNLSKKNIFFGIFERIL